MGPCHLPGDVLTPGVSSVAAASSSGMSPLDHFQVHANEVTPGGTVAGKTNQVVRGVEPGAT